MNYPTYVLVTPVKNEEKTIEITIQSVINQTLLPQEWVIVSDQSTDATDDIVQCYAESHKFKISLSFMENRNEVLLP